MLGATGVSLATLFFADRATYIYSLPENKKRNFQKVMLCSLISMALLVIILKVNTITILFPVLFFIPVLLFDILNFVTVGFILLKIKKE